MNHRGAGVAFCSISAFLFGVRYISAAIFGSGVSSWDVFLFRAMLEYVGNGLTVASIISLLIGVAYLVCAEIKGKNAEKQ